MSEATMTELLELLGKHVGAAEVASALAAYPALRAELEEPGPGEPGEPVRYLRSERDGILFKLSADGEILAIFLMSEGKNGFARFKGPLLAPLTFASTAGDTLKALGAPAYSRPPGKVGSFEHGELLRFDRPGHSIHFQFRSRGAGIDLITAMTARSVPGRSVQR